MCWNPGNKYKKEVEQAFEIINAAVEMPLKQETPEQTQKIDNLAALIMSSHLHEPNLQKFRRALGLKKPMTKKLEMKLFKELRKTVNTANKELIITRNGAMKGVRFQNDDGTFPSIRKARQLVLRSAARYLGAQIDKDKNKPPVDDGVPMHIPEPGAAA
jgi:hypothetical protein